MAVDRNLGEALLRQDRAGPQPALEQILQCERRRVRRWAIATGALWVITVGYLFSLIYFYATFLHPVFNEYFTTPDANPEAMKPRMRVVIYLLQAMLYWPILLFLAAACTVFFTLATRRATLRQIQASLAEISAELKARI
jgi:hypothetical protein